MEEIMFGERLKRIVAITLIIGMVATGNGFTTLAASVDTIVDGGSGTALDQTGPKNYYQMMYEEYYEEHTAVVKTNAGNVGAGHDSTDVAQDSVGAGQDFVEADTMSPKGGPNEQALSTTDKNPSDSEKTEPQSLDAPKSLGTSDPSVSTDSTSPEDDGETESYEEEPEEDATTGKEAGNAGKTQDNAGESQSDAGANLEDPANTKNENHQTENADTATTSHADEEEAKANDEETTASTSDAEVSKEASTSEVDELSLVTDIKSTASTLDFVVSSTSVATTSIATKSEVVYIKATRSAIATTSIWTVERFLIDQDTTGSFYGVIPTPQDMKERYTPKKVKVFLRDQIGNEKIVEIDAKWNYKFINQLVDERFESHTIATKAYVPRTLENRGVKVDVNLGEFREDSVNVAEIEENQKVERAIQEQKSEYYAESMKDEMQGKAVVDGEYIDDIAETVETVESKVEEKKEEETVETEKAEEVIETVAAFTSTLVEEKEENETTNSVEADQDNVEASPEETTDTAVVDPFVVETVYEEVTLDKVSAGELADEKGLQGNIATQIINPSTAEWGVGSELDMDAAFSSLKSMLGEEILIMPELESITLKTFGDGFLGADPTESHTIHRPDYNGGADLSKFGPSSKYANYTISGTANIETKANGAPYSAADKLLEDYAKSSTYGRTTEYEIVLSADTTLYKQIDFQGKNLYLCLNGHTLRFAQSDTLDISTASIIKNVKNVIITTCKNAGKISGINPATNVPYDRKNRVEGLDLLKSTASSCIEASGGQYAGIHSSAHTIEIEYVWSNYHNKIKYTGAETDAAALINTKLDASNNVNTEVWLDSVNVHDLVGCQGGVIKAENVASLTVRNSIFERNRAFKGACFNIKGKSLATSITNNSLIENNRFKNNGYAFLLYNDENPYTFGRFPYEVTGYYPINNSNDIEALVSMSGQETRNASAPGHTADSMKPTDSYQYRNLGYESTVYEYETYVPNGIILIDNYYFGSSTAAFTISSNNITENMPFDLCSTFMLALNNANLVNNQINVYSNYITKNAQYKSSLNEWDSAAGMVIAVNPASPNRHLLVSYELAYRVDENANPVEYQKEVFKNDEKGTSGTLNFYNNIINGNYAGSKNAGAISIRNMREVYINKNAALLTEADSKVVKDNFTAGMGAAYEFFRNGKTRVYNTVFKNNNSLVGGGAVYISGEKDIEFINEGTKENPTVTFTKNYSRSFGGAVYA